MFLRGLIDKATSPLRRWSGAYRRRWQQCMERCGVVAIYHRVIPLGGDPGPGFGVEQGLPASADEAHLRFLLEQFERVSVLDVAVGAHGANEESGCVAACARAVDHAFRAPATRTALG